MKVSRHIPNVITSMNLLCGALGVIATFKGRIDIAFPLMIAAAVFDFLDGFAARLIGAYSDMGKELDSLCDVVSFGLLPALMLSELMKACTWSESVICYIPLVVVVFSALRLANFNIDDRQHDSFIGLPTPAAAMLCGSLCYFVAFDQNTFLAAWCSGFVFIPVLSIVLSILMVCALPMFSMKMKRGVKDEAESLKNRKRLAFAVNVAIIIAIVAALGLNWSLAVLLSFVVYILMNVAFAVFKI